MVSNDIFDKGAVVFLMSPRGHRSRNFVLTKRRGHVIFFEFEKIHPPRVTYRIMNTP